MKLKLKTIHLLNNQVLLILYHYYTIYLLVLLFKKHNVDVELIARHDYQNWI